MNHFEKNRKAWEFSKQNKGIREVLGDDYLSSRIGYTGLGACLSDVRRAYEASERRDYSAVVRTPEAQRFVENLAVVGQASNSMLIAQFNICYHMLNFDAHGRHAYKVSDGLAMKLALTELRGLKCEDLRLPYKALYLEIPGFLGFKIKNAITGWHEVEGIYVSEDNNDSGQGEGTVAQPVDGGRSWRVCVTAKENENKISDNDDAMVYFTIPLVEGWSLDASLANLAARVYKNQKEDPGLYGVAEETIENWIAVFRWTLNVMLYATTPDGEHETVRDNAEAEAIWRRVQKLPKGPKREGLVGRYKQLDPRLRTLLGRSVKVTPNLRTMFEQRGKGSGNGAFVRTYVAGHWQRYAVGPGRKERRWQFVEPYWRGPEDGVTAEAHAHRFT